MIKIPIHSFFALGTLIGLIFLTACKKDDIDICRLEHDGELVVERFPGMVINHLTGEPLSDIQVSFKDQLGGGPSIKKDTFRTNEDGTFDYLYCKNMDSVYAAIAWYGLDTSKLNQRIHVSDEDFIHLYNEHNGQRYSDTRNKYYPGKETEIHALPAATLRVNFENVFFEEPDGEVIINVRLLQDSDAFAKGYARGYSWVVGREFDIRIPANIEIEIKWDVFEILDPNTYIKKHSGEEIMVVDWKEIRNYALKP